MRGEDNSGDARQAELPLATCPEPTSVTDAQVLVEASEVFDADATDLVRRVLALAASHPTTESAYVLQVARLLVEQHADPVSVVSVILAPLHRRRIVAYETLERWFGRDVADLVRATSRLRPFRRISISLSEDDCAELLASSALDPRLIVARAGLALVELEAQYGSGASDLKVLALEARGLLVPLSDRLGLGTLRSRLEDASFRVLEPREYAAVADSVRRIREADDVCLTLVAEQVGSLLERNGVVAQVCTRVKNLWGIYRKMIKKGLPAEGILDRLGLRVVVHSVPDCYRVLGLLHSHFRPIPGTFDDYIGLPKENGYQSLHTCVYPVRTVSAKPVEFQVRTQAMQREAEYGLTAHWLYKSQTDAEDESLRQRLWLREVKHQHDVAVDHDSFLKELRRVVYEQSLVVFLRGGRQARLPDGATVRDLIQRVAGNPEGVSVAYVNSSPATLDATLSDGDTVEWDELTFHRGGDSQHGLSSPR